jgi:predicted alpha/beta hydrolase family esterase
MKTAILIHGMPSKEEYFDSTGPALSNKHWFPWLQRELILNGILVQTPEMPEPYQPHYGKWKETFEQFTINEDTTLVGHSCGGGFLVRWLSENKVKVGKVALVAPWINANHPAPVAGFFDFQIDAELVSRTKGLSLFTSSDDGKEVHDTAELLKNTVQNLQLKEFTDKGHFTLEDMETEKFPELLENLI